MSREQITTRIDPALREVIDREADRQEMTAAHVARRLLERAARELARSPAGFSGPEAA
jgi:hypothetical protein